MVLIIWELLSGKKLQLVTPRVEQQLWALFLIQEMELSNWTMSIY